MQITGINRENAATRSRARASSLAVYDRRNRRQIKKLTRTRGIEKIR